MLKKRKKLEAMIVTFPQREELYRGQIAEIDALLIEIKACRLCGRPLKGEHSMSEGIGPECARKERAKEEAQK
jgi:hypothetical protein